MEIYLKSDIGLVRQTNQDACKCGSFADDVLWAVVCDGMGGAKAGNVASALAVETISTQLKEKYSKDLNEEDIYKLLINTVKYTNNVLYEKQLNNIEYQGMGTTVELVLVNNNKVCVVHVGDSRVYLIRDKKIKQLTVDHSLVQEMVDSGQITQEEAQNHPKKNLITRALGVYPQVRLDYIETSLEKDDIIVMCTDGLSNYLTHQQLIEHCNERNGRTLVKNLVSNAKDLGGSDNITVSVIFY